MPKQVATLESIDRETLPHPSAATPAGSSRAAGRFQYAGGDRPLAGYTIKRGVGQGGFGEIYYAQSDAGKDVALKLIRRNLEVELRGIRQCLNLKHPNLLSLYDIRQDQHGDTWVVMEYVADRSLEDILCDRPAGLPADEALGWIHGIASGVAYLHDRGIVHRDLKPANIFCDQGTVKIGDYGLSKFISCSRRSGHTESIGTVHYMAPEVANGRYGKEIDVYALGVILYELLTGRVPFEGESVGEILMKHLTAKPDVSMLPEPYRGIVSRAMEKDPALRYASAAEMLAALPTPAGEVCRPDASPKAADKGKSSIFAWIRRDNCDSRREPLPPEKPPARQSFTTMIHHRLWRRPESAACSLPANSPRERTADLLGAMLGSTAAAAVVCLVLVVVESYWSAQQLPAPELFAWLLLVGTSGAWLVLVPAALWGQARGDQMLRRFVMMVLGMALGVGAYFLADFLMVVLPPASGYPQSLAYRLPPSFYAADGRPLLLAHVACFGTLFLLVRWWLHADPTRHQRLSLWKVAVGVFTAGATAWVWHFPQPWLPMIAATMSISVQLASPWSSPIRRWRR